MVLALEMEMGYEQMQPIMKSPIDTYIRLPEILGK